MDTCYQIDHADRVISYDAAWIAFAETNAASSLVHRVLGQPLWSFIADPSVRELYRALLQRVRATDQPVTFPFRCDSPAVERHMTLTMRTGSGARGSVAFRATLVREAVHPGSVSAFYASLAACGSGYRRSVTPTGTTCARDVPLTMCSWCKRLDLGGWREIEAAVADGALRLDAPVRPITHGLCPDCHRNLLQDAA